MRGGCEGTRGRCRHSLLALLQPHRSLGQPRQRFDLRKLHATGVIPPWCDLRAWAMTIEEWRPVPGLEGRYDVSNMGRVRSLTSTVQCPGDGSRGPYSRTIPGRILAQHGTPYLGVSLPRSLRGSSSRTHKLVLEAFVGPLPKGMVTRHLNGNHTDNRLENLAYGTPRENGLDTVRHGRHKRSNQTHCIHGHEYTPENTLLNSRGCRTCRACRDLKKVAA